MVYGLIAAFLVEAFRRRFATHRSLPYHFGNGGSRLPAHHCHQPRGAHREHLRWTGVPDHRCSSPSCIGSFSSDQHKVSIWAEVGIVPIR